MSSQSDDQENQPKKETGQASGGDHTPVGGHSPATGYPPTMGYPSTMGCPPAQAGYPPAQTGYHGYYNNNGYSNYPYSLAPPATNHNTHMYQSSHQENKDPPLSFTEVIALTFLFLFLLMFMPSLWAMAVWSPELPEFHVDTLSVSNFNASSSQFTANWDANVTVQNPSTKVTMYFERIESFVFYDYVVTLASSSVQPFYLETKTSNVSHVKITKSSTDEPLEETWAVDKLAKDRSTGMVSFSLKMMISTTFRSGSWETSQRNLEVFCDHINVVFEGATGNGKLAIGKLSNCLVF